MAYTFTPAESFALGTHTVEITSTRLKVKLSSTGQVVFDKSYANGLAFRCNGNNFEIGTLTADNYMTKTVDMSLSGAKLWVEEKTDANKFIGSNDSDDTGIYNIYNLNQCPVLLSKVLSDAVMKCPCEGTPCGNTCYQYGQ